MTKLERVTTQWTSGRFLLTQVAALCLFLITLADCYVAIVAFRRGIVIDKLPFDVGQIFIILVAVFTAYFHKSNDEEPKPEV